MRLSLGEKKRYLVSKGSSDKLCQWSLTKRDVMCIVVGCAIIAASVILFVIIAIAFSPNGSTLSNTEPWKNNRLPVSVKPELYKIFLDPNLDTSAVSGNVTIEVTIKESTSNIILHAKDMDIHKESVRVTRSSSPLPISSQFNYSTNDYYVISLSSVLSEGDTVSIYMAFNYSLRNDLVGFYRSSYTTGDGQRYLATTQFEPTDARRAFPCFDEPAFKANFSISLTHPEGYHVKSNMPVLSSKSTNSVTVFDTTYKMSTYLVAFVVSDFSCSVPDSTSRIKVMLS